LIDCQIGKKRKQKKDIKTTTTFIQPLISNQLLIFGFPSSFPLPVQSPPFRAKLANAQVIFMKEEDDDEEE